MNKTPCKVGIRVKTEEASDISPMLTGQKYVVGDRFIISGIPQDVFPPQLFQALEKCDVPWLGVSGSHRISTRYRGGSYSWIIKCPTQPPTSLFFLDEAVITVHKEEFKIKKDTMDHQPKVSVSAWTRVAQCPKPNIEHAPNAKRMREEGNEQQAMNVEEVTATTNMNTQVNEGRHVPGTPIAPINMPEDERLQKRMKARVGPQNSNNNGVKWSTLFNNNTFKKSFSVCKMLSLDESTSRP